MKLRLTVGAWALCIAFALSGAACADTPSDTSGSASSPLGVGGGSLPSATPTPVATPTPAATPAPAPEPVAASISFVNGPLTARHGQATTLIVKTAPNTGCSIRVVYKSGPSTAQGLGAKTSDGAGNVSWSWIVGSRTTLGQWPIYVTCGSASDQTSINVT
jgi:micrococcal nuclease